MSGMPFALLRPRSRVVHMAAATVAAACASSAPAGAAAISLAPQPPTDWPRPTTATLVVTVPAPAGADVAIGVGRARGHDCGVLAPPGRRVRHVIAVAPGGASLAGAPEDSQAGASVVLAVRAPLPGRSAVVCAWASVADGPPRTTQARVRTPRARTERRAADAADGPGIPRGLVTAFAIAGLAAAGLRPGRRRGAARRHAPGRSRGHGNTLEPRARSQADRRTLCQLGLDARRGADADAQVRAVLDPLEPEGWRITHGVFPPGGGDVDHVAQAPDGIVFVVETKASSHATRTTLEQAARNLRRIAALSDVRADRCRAVLCLAGSRRIDVRVITVHGIAVCVTSPAGLAGLLRHRPRR
jgi:hypothetical protein